MRIYTTRQGAREVKSTPALWQAQVAYLLTTLRRYPHQVPATLREMQQRLRYISDPRGWDTWYTPAEALARGGDDCEGLTNLLLARLLLDGDWTGRGMPPALPVLARFGSGPVIHAVSAIDEAFARRQGIDHLLWDRYPIVYPILPPNFKVRDLSWELGMPFPMRWKELVSSPNCRSNVAGAHLYFMDTL